MIVSDTGMDAFIAERALRQATNPSLSLSLSLSHNG
jgi:hypothetical protein